MASDALRAPVPLTDAGPRRAERRLAWSVSLTAGAMAVVVAPFAGAPLGGGPPVLAIYATAILMTDVITALLLLSIQAARPSRASLVLALGYLFTGLTAAPWALTLPGVFSETGLLDAGLQTTAIIAAARRLVFPLAILTYAVMTRTGSDREQLVGGRGVLAGAALTFFAVLALTALAILGGDVIAFMRDPVTATRVWAAVPAAAALIGLAAIATLVHRGPRSSLDLWLVVVLVTQLIEMAMLAGLSGGERFTLGWWMGRAIGFASSSVVLVMLMFETMAIYNRLLLAAGAERRMREERLATVQALLGAIAHEVNQPFASIVANAGAARRWLDRPAPDFTEAGAAMDRIVAEGHRGADVIDGMRTLLRSGLRWREPVDMSRLVQECAANAKDEAQRARVSIQVPPAHPPAQVQGDAGQLRQAISNLIANAIDAMRDAPGKRVLSLETSVYRRHGEHDFLLIRVADTGPGIAPQDARRIFEPFFTTKGAGTGLGLMIARSAVQSHGGTLELRPGPTGAVFEIELPVSAVGFSAEDAGPGVSDPP